MMPLCPASSSLILWEHIEKPPLQRMFETGWTQNGKDCTRPKRAPRKVPLMTIWWTSFLLEVSDLWTIVTTIKLFIHYTHIHSLSVPYQDNGWDCGVYVWHYGFGIYAIFLHGHVVTCADIGDHGQPFCELISESHEFHFTAFDIVRFLQDLATLLKKLLCLDIRSGRRHATNLRRGSGW